MKTKKCNGKLCKGKEKPLSDFYKDKRVEGRFRPICKECMTEYSKINKNKIAIYQKDYRIQNKEELRKYSKEYREKFENKEKTKEYQIQYRIENKEELSQKQKERYEENKESILKQQQEFYQKNKEKIKARVKKYNKENRVTINRSRNKKLKSDINYKIVNNLRGRLHNALDGISKSKRTLELLGCTVEELKQHLESQFESGMSWDNHSINGWHVDHIKPCSKFNLNKKLEQLKCFNYTNLQPLWAEENLQKGNFYVPQKEKLF